MKEEPLKCKLLEDFAQSQAYQRGHSAGEEEVEAIADGLRYDLRAIDQHIKRLEEKVNAAEWGNDHNQMGG